MTEQSFSYENTYSREEIEDAGQCLQDHEFLCVTVDSTEYVFRETNGSFVLDHTWRAFDLALQQTKIKILPNNASHEASPNAGIAKRAQLFEAKATLASTPAHESPGGPQRPGKEGTRILISSP